MAKLTAGSGNIATAARADVNIQSMRAQHRLETQHIITLRTLKRKTTYFVVPDEIDVCAQPPGDARQFFRMFWAIIHLVQQNIFEGNLAPGPVKVLLAGIE